MVNALPPNWLTPGEGTLLARLGGRRPGARNRHPDEFACAVRVVAGSVPGETSRWSYRRSAVDRLRTDHAQSTVHLRHGRVVLRLTVTGDPRPAPGLRRNHVAWPATDSRTGATVEIGAHCDREREFGPF